MSSIQKTLEGYPFNPETPDREVYRDQRSTDFKNCKIYNLVVTKKNLCQTLIAHENFFNYENDKKKELNFLLVDKLGFCSGNFLLRTNGLDAIGFQNFLSESIFKENDNLWTASSIISRDLHYRIKYNKENYINNEKLIVKLSRCPIGYIPGYLCQFKSLDKCFLINSLVKIQQDKLNYLEFSNSTREIGLVEPIEIFNKEKINENLIFSPYTSNQSTRPSSREEINAEQVKKYNNVKEVWLPKVDVSFLIGKGIRIEQIRKESGCNIKIHSVEKQLNENLFLNNRRKLQKIVLRGSNVQVEHAKFMIEEILHKRNEGLLKY
ncbi:hypothetical protein PACTADRAFT_80097 [Pachysolen tannophilus NRRL Y-2460]|uniref:K Homology domain-containing protein n=1 Tax=Pachysolen tannophilus NRRL Y-2460 TaxID=669874 RepID=A0A1E4TW83_PACTA|nr:hypothetical protein PACTADRAFT_80097 [Pachysolen tannophilus NRRL Y-2460]